MVLKDEVAVDKKVVPLAPDSPDTEYSVHYNAEAVDHVVVVEKHEEAAEDVRTHSEIDIPKGSSRMNANFEESPLQRLIPPVAMSPFQPLVR